MSRVNEHSPDADRAPDPAWGVGIFAVGLLVMAIGGAGNWHLAFNIGEGLLLFGAGVFLLFVTITSHKQEPIRLRDIARRVMGTEDDDEPADGDDDG